MDSVNFDIEYSDGVYYQIFIQADLAQDATIKKLNGIDEVSEFDDVTYVELRKNPGDGINIFFWHLRVYWNISCSSFDYCNDEYHPVKFTMY